MVKLKSFATTFPYHPQLMFPKGEGKHHCAPDGGELLGSPEITQGVNHLVFVTRRNASRNDVDQLEPGVNVIFQYAIYSSCCSFLYDGCLEIKRGDGEWESMHSVLSVLSYMLKAPLVPPGTPIVNALFAQRQCIVNLFRACVGLAPESHLTLEHKLPSALKEAAAAAAADGAPARKRARNA